LHDVAEHFVSGPESNLALDPWIAGGAWHTPRNPHRLGEPERWDALRGNRGGEPTRLREDEDQVHRRGDDSDQRAVEHPRGRGRFAGSTKRRMLIPPAALRS
jgi:hypothetical protein